MLKQESMIKLVNTFVEGLLGYVHEGRIHADINQIRGDQWRNCNR